MPSSLFRQRSFFIGTTLQSLFSRNRFVFQTTVCRFAGKARCFRSLQGWRRCTAALQTFQSVRQRAPEYEQQAEGKEEKTGNGAEDDNEGRLKETQQGYAAAAGQAAFHGRKWKKERPAPGAGLSQT